MLKRFTSPLVLGIVLLALIFPSCKPPSPTPTPLANLNDLQTAPGHLNVALQEQEPETYAGLWIEHEPNYRVIVLFTKDGEKTLAPYISGSVMEGLVDVRAAKYSLAELTSTEHDIYQLIRNAGLPFEPSVDINKNQVTVYVTNPKLWESTLQEKAVVLPEYVHTEVIYEPLQGTPDFPVTPVSGLFFPQLRARSTIFMTALLEGQLISEDGCLRVETSYSPQSSLIIWQPDYFPTLNGDQIEVLDRAGKVVARRGEPITLGGGGIELTDDFARQLREPMPAACDGPYFLMGGLVSQPTYTPQVTNTLTPSRPILTPTYTPYDTATVTPSPGATDTPTIFTPIVPTNTPTKSGPATPTKTATPIVHENVTSCPGAPAIANKLNSWAQVSVLPPISNKVRTDPGLSGERIGLLNPGEIVRIVDGPRCADSYTWWFVKSLSGLEGWTAEGDASGAWLVQPLEWFFYDSVNQSSTSKTVLSMGQKYRVTMAGTYSIWFREQWTSPGVCIRGESEPLPMFPTPLKTNGPVGADPYYRFARPFYGPCQEPTDSSEMISPIMLSLDGGNTYSLAVPVVAKYREDHTYTYVVMGRGYPLKVRLDDVPLDDNYGEFIILIEKIDK